MKAPKVCAIKGPIGEQELNVLINYAADGWNIAFMDPSKEIGEQLKKKLLDEFNLNINVLNYDNNRNDAEYDIEGFFFHGSWREEEDIDLYWAFLDGKYGGVNHIIESVA